FADRVLTQLAQAQTLLPTIELVAEGHATQPHKPKHNPDCHVSLYLSEARGPVPSAPRGVGGPVERYYRQNGGALPVLRLKAFGTPSFSHRKYATAKSIR